MFLDLSPPPGRDPRCTRCLTRASEVAASPRTICNFPLGMFQELRDILYLCPMLSSYDYCRRGERRRDEINLGQSPCPLFSLLSSPPTLSLREKEIAAPHIARFSPFSSVCFSPPSLVLERRSNRNEFALGTEFAEYALHSPNPVIAYFCMRRDRRLITSVTIRYLEGT